MQTGKTKITAKWFFVVLCLAFGMSATLNTGWLFSSYYQLTSVALNLNAAQMGILLSITDACGIAGYVIGGILCDTIRPKACIVIGSIGMALFSLWCMTIPSYFSVIVICTGLVVFGIVFYWTACVRYAQNFGPEALSGKATGFLYGLSGLIMLIYGNVISGVIASVDEVSGLRWLLGSSTAILVVCAIAQCIYDKEPWFGKGLDKVSTEGRFSFKMIGTVLSNPRYLLVLLVAALSISSAIAITYMSPLLASYYGASTATVTLISTWANNGTLLILSFLTGYLVDKLGSATKVLIASFCCMMVGVVLLLVTPWEPSKLFVVVIAMVLVRCVNAIGKPGRVALVAESGVPAAARGTATGLMFAATSIPGTFLYTIFGNMLTAHDGGPAGYRTIFVVFVFIGIAGIATVAAFAALNKKYKASHAAGNE